MCLLSKEQSILSRETIQNAFFSRIMPLFRLRLFIFYQVPHSRALAPVCGALVFEYCVLTEYVHILPTILTNVFGLICRNFLDLKTPSPGGPRFEYSRVFMEVSWPRTVEIQGLYLSTILSNVLYLVLQIYAIFRRIGV